MRFRSWMLWVGLGVVALLVVSAAGGIWALRRWPEKVVPRLLPSVAVALVGVAGEEGRNAIGDRLRQPDAESLVMAWLHGSRSEQLQMCGLLKMRGMMDYGLSDRISECLYGLANEVDEPIRLAARQLVGASMLSWLGRQVDAGNFGETITGVPVVGLQARKALALWVFQGAGYNHKMPGKYKKRCKSLLVDVLAKQDDEGRFAVDPEDNGIIVTAVAEAYAITNDAALLPPLHSAVAGLRSAWPSSRVGGLWTTETRVAMAQLFAWKALVSGGVITRDAMFELRSDFDAAWAAAGPEYSHFPWYAAGHIQDIPAAESLAAAQCAAVYLGKTDLEGQIPLQRLSLPGDFRTMEGHWWVSALFQHGEMALVEAQWSKLRDSQVYRWNDDSDGSWDPVPGVGDRYLVSVFAILNQQFYRRYTAPSPSP